MAKKLFLAFVLMALAGCQFASPTQVALPVSTQPPETAIPTKEAAPTSGVNPATVTPLPVPTSAPPTAQPSLAPFTIDWNKPFIGSQLPEFSISLPSWTPKPYTGENIVLPLHLGSIVNPQVLRGMTSDQRAFLSQNGFVVIHSQEAQFGDIRMETAARSGQPYYLTTDAAFHALHLLFDDMLKSIERDYFRAQLIYITQATLEQVRSYLPVVKGTSLEAETLKALAYLSVAQQLLTPGAPVNPIVADLVSKQVDQVMAAAGPAKSVIFPEFEDDYGAYKPVGHYSGDLDLEAYFRAMTWYGRMHFLLKNPDVPDFVPSRVPLIVTLALRQGSVGGVPTSDTWAQLHKTLTFVIGPSDDAGPLEYAALMDQVYGNRVDIRDLAVDNLWQEFLSQADQLPAPQINSLFIQSTTNPTAEKGWRFMGQRFTLDGLIMQNVIFDRLEARSDGTKRELPSGLDVMAAFGSQPALTELENMGVTTFPNYLDQMAKMQQTVQQQPEEQWLGRFYDGWLYSFLPVLQAKDNSYPAYMQTTAWSYKEMNAALGSWAELKHDTILYTKMPEMLAGGGPPTSGPTPGYVEPNPLAFYRMAYISKALSCGLQNRVLLQPCDLSGFQNTSTAGFIYEMAFLGERFEQLGAIAEKELAGTPLSADDYATINDCLGATECMNTAMPQLRTTSEMPKLPVIAAVAGAKDNVLEVGVGGVDRLYVVLPLEGKQEVAQGGVFSYYEFTQPRDQRLTDDEWRQKLASGGQASPAWATQFRLNGGQPTESLFFRIGDIYTINEAGNNINLREEPSISAPVLMQLPIYTYVEIIDGPLLKDGYTWWKYKVIDFSSDNEITGWMVENPDWFTRSY